ncbi:hypothetical protein HPB48_026581 [Haemaphysalis longicornis]|uniref:Uncharacterized protein n=1 Tax=Haemaphysalis longicornis TaxID=44386 RepID=A0A9J6HCN8_HAELO|nr:hypothetical protein HPB48_026581 [Haemaphysalis longicornis]
MRGKTHRKLRRNESNKASQWNTPERISGGAQALTIAGKNPDKPQVANDQHEHQNARGCPPQSRQREVVMAGDNNVSLLAETLMAETGSRGTFEFLYGAKAMMADAVRYATDFEKKAPSTQRQYILHAGIHDVLQGTSEGITDILSREWSGRRGQLTVCSIPEITSRGGETGQRFIDMNKIELPIGYGKDGFHYSEDSTRLISRLIGQSLVRFLDRGRPTRLGKPKPLTRMLSKEGQLPVQHGHKRGDPKTREPTTATRHLFSRPTATTVKPPTQQTRYIPQREGAPPTDPRKSPQRKRWWDREIKEALEKRRAANRAHRHAVKNLTASECLLAWKSICAANEQCNSWSNAKSQKTTKGNWRRSLQQAAAAAPGSFGPMFPHSTANRHCQSSEMK